MVFLIHALSTLFMTGLIWFVQVVHYPLFNDVGEAAFSTYELRHSRLTTLVVIGPMFAELITAAVLVWRQPDFVASWEAWVGLGLVGVIWFSTAFLQVPQHSVLTNGFDQTAYQLLLTSNWLRTAAWSLRATLVTLWLHRLL